MAEPVSFRLLDPEADRGLVRAFYRRAADYVHLETGLPPDEGTVEAFFTGAPPGRPPEAALHPGLIRGGRLDGIAELSLGALRPEDACLGLMILAPEARGQGLGRLYLDHVAGLARALGASRLWLAVLDANPRGRAFWEREGFRHVLTTKAAWTGERLHVRHRMVREL